MFRTGAMTRKAGATFDMRATLKSVAAHPMGDRHTFCKGI
jgi:hypothetical protein